MKNHANRKHTHPASRPSKRRSCEGKRRYGRGEAQATARVLRSQQGDEVYAYPCLYCRRQWHVGHGASQDQASR